MAYRLSDGRVTFCNCFREAWHRYFVYLQEELPNEYIPTYRERVQGQKLLKLAFQHLGRGMHPEILKFYFPSCSVLYDKPRTLQGRVFFYGNREVTPPELDQNFWDAPNTVFRYQDGICEVCTGRVPSHFYCHKMYGSPFLQVYGAWVRNELICQGFCGLVDGANNKMSKTLWREAENKMRTIVGVPQIGERFISETVLFKIITYLLIGHEVIHHYRADWLGRQELDIYVPSLKLAVEYQGEQHFEPIEAWGGEDGFEKTQLRDEEKMRKCERKGVKLIYFDYLTNLTEDVVARTLERTLRKNEDNAAL